MAKCGKGCMPECEYFTTGGCISLFSCPYKIETGYINSATSTTDSLTGLLMEFDEMGLLRQRRAPDPEKYAIERREKVWAEVENESENARLVAEQNEYALEYKGYHTYIHYSAADKILYGKIEGIKDLVDFESESAVEIENEFHKAVDDYIAFCKEVGKGVEEEKGE